jgi:hypothetical protein
LKNFANSILHFLGIIIWIKRARRATVKTEIEVFYNERFIV